MAEKNLRRELSLLWIMALSFAVGYAFFNGKIRYRVPVEPYLIILSAYGIHASLRDDLCAFQIGRAIERVDHLSSIHMTRGPYLFRQGLAQPKLDAWP